jgi:hypothetical protein
LVAQARRLAQELGGQCCNLAPAGGGHLPGGARCC